MSSYHILESEYFKTGKKALSDGDIRDEFNRVVPNAKEWFKSEKSTTKTA